MSQFNYSEADVAKLVAKGGILKEHGVRPSATSKAAPASQIDPCAPLAFMASCEHYGLPRPTPEHQFHADRKWRFDYAWLRQKVALEIEGGAGFGRHTRRAGFIKDIEKYNAATLMGWKLLRCVPADVKDESVFELLKQILKR